MRGRSIRGPSALALRATSALLLVLRRLVVAFVLVGTSPEAALRATSALLLVLRRLVVAFVLVGVETELLGLVDGDEKVLALGVVRLDELLVDLIDDLLKLVVGEIDLYQQRAVDLEASVVNVDPADSPGAP